MLSIWKVINNSIQFFNSIFFIQLTSLEDYYIEVRLIQWNARNYWNKWVGLGRGQKIVAWPGLDTGSPTDLGGVDTAHQTSNA